MHRRVTAGPRVLPLAHQPQDAVVRAYARSDYFEERRTVMDAYARYVCGENAE